MPRRIEVVAGAFAIIDDREVIGAVTKMNETQWAFFAFVPGRAKGVSSYVPLQYAIEEAMKFERS